MKFDCLDKEATQTGFADLVGVSQQAISSRVKSGQLVMGETYWQWLLVYTEDLREHAAGRGGDEQAEFQRSRAQDMAATAALKRITYHEKIDTLVIKEEARGFLGDWARFANSEFNNAFDSFIRAIEEKAGEPVDPGLREKYAGAAIRRVRDFALKLREAA